MRRVGTFLEDQCLGLCTLTAGGAGSVFGWETKIPLLHSTTEKQRERERERESEKWGGAGTVVLI